MVTLKNYNNYLAFFSVLNIQSDACIAAVKTDGTHLEWQNGVPASSGYWGFTLPQNIDYLLIYLVRNKQPAQLWFAEVIKVTHKVASKGEGIVYRLHFRNAVLKGETSALWTVFTGSRQANGYRILQQSSTSSSATVQKTENTLPAVPVGNLRPEKILETREIYRRRDDVHDYALQRAKECCQGCNNRTLPVLTDDKNVFLEVHHVKYLRDKGPDTPDNTVALCPRCHKRAHVSHDRELFSEYLYETYDFLTRY